MTDDRMGGMDAGPGTDLGALGFCHGVWVVMMAAMMFPSIAPMVLMYARIQEGKRERGQPVRGGSDRAVRRRLPDHLGGGRAGRLRALSRSAGRSTCDAFCLGQRPARTSPAA